MDIMEQMKFIRRLPEPMEMKQEIPLKPEYAELKGHADLDAADRYAWNNAAMAPYYQVESIISVAE